MVKPAFKPKKILWVDLEMTGLFPREDVILEVAAIVTDWEFEELASFQAIVKQDQAWLEGKLSGQFWDENPEARDGLLAQNSQGDTTEEVEQRLLSFIHQNFEKDMPVLLAGNSIHMDRQFIDYWWPAVATKLHYRMLDVSAWKVVFEGRYRKKFAKPETHRALNDIRGSIEELKYYLKKVKS